MSASIKRRRRTRSYAGLAALALATILVLLGANRLSRMLFERPPARVDPPASMLGRAANPGTVPVDEAGLFRVVGADGDVDAFREGRWITIRRGELLTRQDIVRTAPGAHAVLRLGASTEIELREKVEIRLDRLSGTGASVDLRRGKVLARVARAGDQLTISASETKTSNDGPAHFIVMADEISGRVSVAATEGSARFSSGGKEVIVREGTESRSEHGGVPADPEKIPEDVFLIVVWPQAERHDTRAEITGSVRASSTATINGQPMAVGADGKFSASLPLHTGPNDIRVETEDLLGRRRANATNLVRRAAQQPELTPVQRDLWKR